MVTSRHPETLHLRPELRQDYPLNLSISIDKMCTKGGLKRVYLVDEGLFLLSATPSNCREISSSP